MTYPEEKLKQAVQNCSRVDGPSVTNWMKEMILYEIYVRNFTEEGTFLEVVPHLDRLKKMGITAIWLMPIHPIGKVARKGKMGCPYSVMDYMEVNPEYGSKDDFRTLVEQTHKRGMKIIIDMVANHSSHDNVNIREHPEWFYKDAAGKPTRRREDWGDVIDNDFRSRRFWKYMKDALLYWVREFDVDGYRCDVAGMVPLEFWEEATEELRKIKPDVYMLAEWENPLLCEKSFNSDHHYELYWRLKDLRNGVASPADLINIIVANKKYYPGNYLPLNFIENHDQPRALNIFGVMGYQPAAALIFTIPGRPLIYNGQEIGKMEYISLFGKESINWEIRNLCCIKFYEDLINLRKSNPVFIHGDVIPLVNSRPDRILSYMVKTDDDIVCVFLNFSARNTAMEVKFPRYINYRPGQVIFQEPKIRKLPESSDYSMQISMRGYGTVIMR